MSDANKYIEQLNQLGLKRKERASQLRRSYKTAKGLTPSILDKEYSRYRNMGEQDAFDNEPEIRAYARRLMEVGTSDKEAYSKGGVGIEYVNPFQRFYLALHGALLYEKIGKGKRIIPKLLKAAKVNKSALGSEAYEQIKEFIEKNTKERSKGSGLEGRVTVFILSSIAGIALSISSLTATGNAISNLTNTAQGLFGLILFVVGIAGLVFGRK